ncbi:MAG TPA: NADH-quinone oxidoreductase subunit NuoE [Gammaproteobacteria bacterium]|nr:NADH-quinone oxidoreductase subunit NuoE [Gammaproteobacteria bacterium]
MSASQQLSVQNSKWDDSVLSPEVRVEIDHWISKFPPERKRSAVLMALRLVQQQNGGWVTVELMDAVADYLDLPKIAVYEVASFYTLIQTEPVGRHKIAVCNSISCMLNGSGKLLEHLEQRLGIHPGETTADGEFTLKEVECLAACTGAPMLQIDDREYHENLTLERVDAILEEIRGLESNNV